MADDAGKPIEKPGSVEQPSSDEPQRPSSPQSEPGRSPITQDATSIVMDKEGPEGGTPPPYLVVAIGASAEGVEAYIELLGSLATNTGTAFIVIPHLLAHKSHLVDILARHISMPVREIADGTRPEPDHVYILPPNTRVQMEKGVLRLEPRTVDGVPRPIDHFFRSLATDQKHCAVGLVFSGTDSGCLGLKAIEGEGGITKDGLRALAGRLFESQEEERRRVARDLHDDIGQKLAVLAIQAGQVEVALASDPERARQDLQRVKDEINTLSEDVRRISHALHPSMIDDLGAAPAIRALVDDFRDLEGMIVTFAAQDLPGKIPNQVTTGLYRIAQEALRNVAKHAGRTHVKVILKGESGVLRLQVMDYGEGFDIDARRSGLGLVSMEERARLLGGAFRIDSKPGEGTRITVEVPLPQST